jgi:hypothetical protein
LHTKEFQIAVIRSLLYKSNMLRVAAYIGIACLACPAFSYAHDGSRFAVSRPGDIELDCGQISAEATHMRMIITQTQDERDTTKMRGRGIGVAGAVGTFLAGTATGGLGFAAAGMLAKEANEEKSETAETTQDIAEQRLSFMQGIFNAKGCVGPLETDTSVIREKVNVVEPAAGAPRSDNYNE